MPPPRARRVFSRCRRLRSTPDTCRAALGRGRRRVLAAWSRRSTAGGRMGDDWRMDIGERKTALVTGGLFQRIRHPIYAFSMLLIVCSALIVPTPPMIAIALVHLDADEHQGTQRGASSGGRAWGQLSHSTSRAPAGSFRGSRRVERFVAIAGRDSCCVRRMVRVRGRRARRACGRGDPLAPFRALEPATVERVLALDPARLIGRRCPRRPRRTSRRRASSLLQGSVAFVTMSAVRRIPRRDGLPGERLRNRARRRASRQSAMATARGSPARSPGATSATA